MKKQRVWLFLSITLALSGCSLWRDPPCQGHSSPINAPDWVPQGVPVHG